MYSIYYKAEAENSTDSEIPVVPERLIESNSNSSQSVPVINMSVSKLK
jgi:hypothetical protein